MGMPYDGAPTDFDQEELDRFKMGPVRTVAASVGFGIAVRFCFRAAFAVCVCVCVCVCMCAFMWHGLSFCNSIGISGRLSSGSASTGTRGKVFAPSLTPVRTIGITVWIIRNNGTDNRNNGTDDRNNGTDSRASGTDNQINGADTGLPVRTERDG